MRSRCTARPRGTSTGWPSARPRGWWRATPPRRSPASRRAGRARPGVPRRGRAARRRRGGGRRDARPAAGRGARRHPVRAGPALDRGGRRRAAHRRDGAALRGASRRGRAWPAPCSTRSSPTAPRSAGAATTSRCPDEPNGCRCGPPAASPTAPTHRSPTPPTPCAPPAPCTTPERARRYAAWLNATGGVQRAREVALQVRRDRRRRPWRGRPTPGAPAASRSAPCPARRAGCAHQRGAQRRAGPAPRTATTGADHARDELAHHPRPRPRGWPRCAPARPAAAAAGGSQMREEAVDDALARAARDRPAAPRAMSSRGSTGMSSAAVNSASLPPNQWLTIAASTPARSAITPHRRAVVAALGELGAGGGEQGRAGVRPARARPRRRSGRVGGHGVHPRIRSMVAVSRTRDGETLAPTTGLGDDAACVTGGRRAVCDDRPHPPRRRPRRAGSVRSAPTRERVPRAGRRCTG